MQLRGTLRWELLIALVWGQIDVLMLHEHHLSVRASPDDVDGCS